MLVNKQSRLLITTQNIIFYIFFLTIIGLLAWLSLRYTYHADWSASNRNSLSSASTSLLNVIDKPLQITAYASEDEALRRQIQTIIKLYQRQKPDIEFSFISPEAQPDKTRQQGISVNGELVIEYEGRRENIKEISEQAITNALQRVVRGGDRWIVFLEGHGERRPYGQANHDLQGWVAQLENKGFNIQSINLINSPRLPDNTTVLVLAGAQVAMLPGEISLIENYIKQGGNVLWLADTDSHQHLETISEILDLEFQDGTIIDPNTRQLLNVDNLSIIVANYYRHPITEKLNNASIFPQALSIEVGEARSWKAEPFLESLEGSWLETGEIDENLELNTSRDITGPLVLGVALHRPISDLDINNAGDEINENQQQRVAVVGDGDFLSNQFLGNGGNLNLGLSILNWLSNDDTFIAIPAKTAPDLQLSLSRTAQILIAFGFLIALPAILISTGALIWFKRRNQ